MIRVIVATCAYSSPQLIYDFWRSLKPELHDSRLDASLMLFRHGGWLDIERMCKMISADSPKVLLLDYGVNRGLSQSWNDAIEFGYGEGADAVVIANDDIRWTSGDLFKLAQACATASEDVYGVMVTGDHAVNGPRTSLGHSLFAYTRPAEAKLGYFDQNFFPAYCEDQDIDLRAKHAGMRQIGTELGAWHAGSAHWRGYRVPADRRRLIQEQNVMTHALNQEYLARKWGDANPDKCTFTTPFNDPAFSPYFIAAEDRHAPYPGYDRTDLAEVVRL